MVSSMSQARQELRAAIKSRSRRRYNVWHGFASKGNFEFSLDGTPKADHLVWMEGDPEISSYTCPPKKNQSHIEPEWLIPDVIVMRWSGAIEWHVIQTESNAKEFKQNYPDRVLNQTRYAKEHGASWRLITTADLNKQAQLINNWRRGLSYITAAHSFDFGPYESDVITIVSLGRQTTLANVLSAFSPENESLLIAAFFRLIQKGKIASDLHKKEFGLQTRVWLRPDHARGGHERS